MWELLLHIILIDSIYFPDLWMSRTPLRKLPFALFFLLNLILLRTKKSDNSRTKTIGVSRDYRSGPQKLDSDLGVFSVLN